MLLLTGEGFVITATTCRAPHGGSQGSVVDMLEDALDFLHDRQARFLGRYVISHNVERRTGGQGVVQFGRVADAQEEVAIKFYTHKEAFTREAELYRDSGLKRSMPATLAIVANEDGSLRTPYGFSFPPCIIIERGQSLNEWASANVGDFITIFQACALRSIVNLPVPALISGYALSRYQSLRTSQERRALRRVRARASGALALKSEAVHSASACKRVVRTYVWE
jgi:hypothetical protein